MKRYYTTRRRAMLRQRDLSARKKRPMRFFKYVDENASSTHVVADKAIRQRRQQQIIFFQALLRLLF